jgi:DNA-binding PadR family transcriptional regulator
MLRLITDRPRHGYELIREIEDMSGGQYVPSPGLIYPTITLLTELNMVKERPGRSARKSFEGTAEGTRHAEEHAAEIEALFMRLRELGKDSGTSGSRAPVRRAVQNLIAALETALESRSISDQRIDEITDLIDKTTRDIERLR